MTKITRDFTDSNQNTYIISINVANKLREQYYHEYVPELLDVRYTTVSLSDVAFPADGSVPRVCKTSMRRELPS